MLCIRHRYSLEYKRINCLNNLVSTKNLCIIISYFRVRFAYRTYQIRNNLSAEMAFAMELFICTILTTVPLSIFTLTSAFFVSQYPIGQLA